MLQNFNIIEFILTGNVFEHNFAGKSISECNSLLGKHDYVESYGKNGSIYYFDFIKINSNPDDIISSITIDFNLLEPAFSFILTDEIIELTGMEAINNKTMLHEFIHLLGYINDLDWEIDSFLSNKSNICILGNNISASIFSLYTGKISMIYAPVRVTGKTIRGG